MQCPKCNSNSAHRSHRRGLIEHLVALAGYYPYRCHSCKHRYMSTRYQVPKGPPTSTEAEIRRTRSKIRWEQKRRELFLYGFGIAVFLAFLYYITRPRMPGE